MKAKITFKKIIQDSQDYGSTEEHMVSRVFFDLEIEGKKFPDLYVDVKQTVGSEFETAPIEVGAPHEYSGPFDHEIFRKEVENYYRESFGSKGSAIRIEGGAKNIRMRNNVSVKPRVVGFEIKGTRSGW